MTVPHEEEVRLLSMANILEPLSEEELDEFARRHPDTRLQEGEHLFGPHELGERIYILKEGRIQLYRVNPEGQEVTLAVVEQGRLFGEMALTAQRLRELYARAMEPSLVVSLRAEDLEELIRSKPEVGLRLARSLSERLRQCEELLEEVRFKEVPARLASLILRFVDSEGVKTEEGFIRIPTRYTHEQLGTIIGANRVAVSRAFARLREAGAIEPGRRRIHVKDPEALRRIAARRGRGERRT